MYPFGAFKLSQIHYAVKSLLGTSLCNLLGLSNYAKFIMQFAPTPTPLLIKFDLPPTTEIAHYVIKRSENSAHPVNNPRWLQTRGGTLLTGGGD